MISEKELPEARIIKKRHVSIAAPLLSDGGAITSTFELEIGKTFIIRHQSDNGEVKSYEMSVNPNGMSFKVIKE